MESNIGHCPHFCRFTLAGENLVGQKPLAGDINAIIDIYVADASY
ncbi:hypothetical protein ykris0001_30930 [Yersinia kristensenii ATCC 33638]|nr:hypothetical protein ykris0001_30930 [Yersinia kristensenii ATCC 33638]